MSASAPPVASVSERRAAPRAPVRIGARMIVAEAALTVFELGLVGIPVILLLVTVVGIIPMKDEK